MLLIVAAACGPGVAGEAQTRAAASGSDPTVHTLTMALPTSAASAPAADAEDAQAFRALVESLSRGRIAVTVDAAGERCGGPDACLAALQAGAVDIHRSTVPGIGRLMPELHVLDVPYLLETDAVVERVFRGAFFARVRDALLHRTGLRLMALASAGGWRGIATASGPVRTPADLRGLTLATADSPVERAWAEALGASPAPGTESARAAAIASGAVDGAAAGVVELVEAGVGERLRYLTEDRHGYRAALWLMNEASFEALPPDLRQIVRAGFDELGRRTLARARDRAREARAAFEAAGGQVRAPSAAERRAFVMAAGRVSTWYMDEYGYEWLVWFEGAIAEAEREIALAAARRDAARQ